MAFRRQRTIAGVAACLAVALAATGCADSEPEAKDDVWVVPNPTFEPGSSMEKLHEKDRLTIGVKIDQPGVGMKEPGDKAPEGFDIEMAKIIAGKMGIAPGKIRWVEAVPENREKYLQNGTVDLILATYSITPERRRTVGMAGPYYETGQQLLVRKDDSDIKGPSDVDGKRVCSVAGTTSIQRVEDEYGAEPVPDKTYTACVDQLLDGAVDAVTTDGALLLGYAAEKPDELKVVGDPFSTERYGVGYRKGDDEMCEFLNKALNRSYRDGTWVDALSKTLWKTTGAVPYPDTDPCPGAKDS
ncbi:glutamate ABC transporter substrate-binding protein [Streptomyces sp. NPDC047108]|uniref:glutamate ABC transporter substrate-binding protein n=1 Tax=Streptomyces sp. NPDC047108 TaxID=3155025 RepID=UPI003408E482